LKITKVSAFEVRSQVLKQPENPRQRQVHPLDIYPRVTVRQLPGQPEGEFRRRATYLEVRADEGISGIFGPLGDPAGQIPAIKRDLVPLLIGRDPLSTNLIHDLMFRLDRHGRSGHFVTAISAVDCALWDLKGKAWSKPVFELLGGPTRDAVPAYASMLGYSVEPEEAASAARNMVREGYRAQKWFFAYGPDYDGNSVGARSVEEGIARNVDMASAVRDAVGEYYPLMFDAFMGWDLSYAVRMAKLLEPLDPAWLEEPLAPEHLEGFRRLHESTSVPIATGEHVYGRWQTREILAAGCVSVLQNDPEWTGGISELSRICSLASSYDVPVIAHGHGLLPALHVAASESPVTVPYVEYLVAHQEAKQYFHSTVVSPQNGMVRMPELHGLGFELDESKIESRLEL